MSKYAISNRKLVGMRPFARYCLSEVRLPQSGCPGRGVQFAFISLGVTARPVTTSTTRIAFSTSSIQREDQTESQSLQIPDLSGPLLSSAEIPTLQTLAKDPTGLRKKNNLDDPSVPRLPRSVQSIYLKPLKRRAKYGLPACDLQLRSYSVRNLEFFTDFALRAAYYLYLPAAGPVPLPRITERWTVPRGNFVHKKSQENFQRITLRRLIQIQDGNSEIVEIWLAFLRKHAYHGVGMKANVWGYEKLGVGKTMDVSLENLKHVLEPKWAHFGRRKNLETSERVFEMMNRENFRQTADAPMSESYKPL